jgi:hypothetical protein
VSIEELMALLWADYAAITPVAERIHQLLRERGETVVNDHIALRTFSVPEVDIEVLDRAFVAAGYQPAESYEFPDKRLHACHYEHESRALPKVFISALLVDELSTELRSIVADLVAQVPPGLPARAHFAASGRPWQVSFSTYERLRRESEYAAWVAAFGFRANHFTVDVNALESFADLGELNRFLVEQGFELSRSGGEIKGSPEVYLEQSSTVADAIEIEFSDGTFEVPSCYYEFARRHRLPDGSMFQGFVAGSADRLFESTDFRA